MKNNLNREIVSKLKGNNFHFSSIINKLQPGNQKTTGIPPTNYNTAAKSVQLTNILENNNSFDILHKCWQQHYHHTGSTSGVGGGQWYLSFSSVLHSFGQFYILRTYSAQRKLLPSSSFLDIWRYLHVALVRSILMLRWFWSFFCTDSKLELHRWMQNILFLHLLHRLKVFLLVTWHTSPICLTRWWTNFPFKFKPSGLISFLCEYTDQRRMWGLVYS